MAVTDPVFRDLWIASILVRAVSLLFGWRHRAPLAWCVWAAFYLATGLAGIIANYAGLSHWYPAIWYTQQIGSALMLGLVLQDAIAPTDVLVGVSVLVAIAVSGTFSEIHHWPNRAVETVMWNCGTAILAMAIVACVGIAPRFKTFSAILAGFLLLYAILMLGGADYLTKPQIGIAWSLLEISAFGAWAFLFGVKRASMKE